MIGLGGVRRRGAAVMLGVALAAAPAAGQAPEAARAPRDIAAGAHAALLVIYALTAAGDTLGTGTGFAVSHDGLFVTNLHVIEVAERLRVESLEGHAYGRVSLVATDAPHDLAVLRVEGTLRPLALGRDDDAQVGDAVFVMGNPLGMNGTFTDGMVSGKRPVEGVAMLQISAPISPGSSGGPVMDAQGRVIGVATLILAGGQNINLAVPVRYLRPLLAGGGAP
ncbi:MAG TPA: S1C family serine protease, partial [Longimicrobiaceae bacterium]|nr:S1C family serine protease [Longimicrobiaceae bacterium]